MMIEGLLLALSVIDTHLELTRMGLQFTVIGELRELILGLRFWVNNQRKLANHRFASLVSRDHIRPFLYPAQNRTK